jgi:aconitase B
MLLPDQVGTGGDSHTRFPSASPSRPVPAWWPSAPPLGVIPLDMPESVLVRFKGEMQPGITLRDLVNAIPYYAIQRGLLTVEKKGKKNVYNGRILEIEGLPNLTVEQAFELSDASAERSAGGCTIELSEESVAEYLRSNIHAALDDRQRLRGRAHPGAPRQGDGRVAGEPDADARRCRRRVRRGHRDQHVRDQGAAAACPNDPDDASCCPRWPATRSTRCSSAPA